MTIGKNIRRLRQEKEMSQSALAKELHVSQGAVSQWENETSSPDINQIATMCNFFSISIDTLVHGDVRQEMKKSEQMSLVETKLISDFRSLTREGKEHVIDYVGAMCVIYKKPAAYPRVEDL